MDEDRKQGRMEVGVAMATCIDGGVLLKRGGEGR